MRMTQSNPLGNLPTGPIPEVVALLDKFDLKEFERKLSTNANHQVWKDLSILSGGKYSNNLIQKTF